MEIGFLTLITYWANGLLGLGRDRIDQYTKSSCRNRPRMDVVSEGLELAPFDSRRDACHKTSFCTNGILCSPRHFLSASVGLSVFLLFVWCVIQKFPSKFLSVSFVPSLLLLS